MFGKAQRLVVLLNCGLDLVLKSPPTRHGDMDGIVNEYLYLLLRLK